MVMLFAVLLVPTGGAWAVLLVVVLTALWLVVAGLPPRHAAGALGVGLLLYTPLIVLLAFPLIAPLLPELIRSMATEPVGASEGLRSVLGGVFLERIGWILIKGVSSLLISGATVSTIGAADVYPAISGLPLPTTARLILIQIVQQAGMLLNETGRVRAAVALRGGGRGGAGSHLLMRSLPGTWLARVAGRAERVASAMDVRGYVTAPLPPITRPVFWRTADRVALLVTGLSLVAVLVLRARS
ncbi:hypothetical protein BH23GEM6_BH23GEM6_23420 [soil metagenome]